MSSSTYKYFDIYSMYGTTKLFFCFNDTFRYYFSFTNGYYIARGVHSGSILYNVGVYPRNHRFHRMFDFVTSVYIQELY